MNRVVYTNIKLIMSYYLAKLVLILLYIYIYIMGYRRITRGRKAHSSKGKGKGTSKFKPRYRKMRGGGDMISYPDDPVMKLCTDPDSKLGGEFSDITYDMNSYEDEVNSYIKKSSSNTRKSLKYVIDPPPGMFTRNSKVDQGMKTEYVDRRMQMGFFVGEGALSFKRAKLYGIGLTVFLKQSHTPPSSCTDADSCKAVFFSNDDVVTDKTAQVFFGGFAKSPTHGSVKQGFGLCYVVDTNNSRGRLYMGYWHQGKMHGMGIEVDFEVTGDPQNPYKAIGIFFGNFYFGLRDRYGMYLAVVDGTLNYVFYPRDGDSCVIDSSYDGSPQKQKEFKRAAKLSSTLKFTNGTARLVNLGEYEKFLRSHLDHLVSTMGGLDKSTSVSLTDMDRQVYKAYKPVYINFVKFCFDLLSMVRKEYVAKRDEDKITREAADATEKSMEEAIAQAMTKGRLGNIEDPRKKQEIDSKIAVCVAMLTDAEYDVKSPDEKQQLEKEKLETIKREHEELTAEKTGFEQAAIKAAILLNQPKAKRSSGSRSSSSYTSPPPVTLSFEPRRRNGSRTSPSPSPRFTSPSSSPGVRRKLSPRFESIHEEGSGERGVKLGESFGGGKMTRKNMRTRTRMRRVKSSRGRRGGSQCGVKV